MQASLSRNLWTDRLIVADCRCEKNGNPQSDGCRGRLARSGGASCRYVKKSSTGWTYRIGAARGVPKMASSSRVPEPVGAPQPAVLGAALLETNIPALVPDEVAGREHESVPHVCSFAACLALLALQGAAYSFPFLGLMTSPPSPVA